MAKAKVQTQDDFIGHKQRVLQASHKRPEHAGDKVTVACKLPSGLRLKIDRMMESQEPVMGGGYRTFKIARPVTDIVLHGTAVPFGSTPRYRIVGGYALTEGVDRELWEQWLKSNEDSAYVKERLVFAMASLDRATDAAEDNEDSRSGLEPLTPPDINGNGDDPRLPKRRSGNIDAITQADRR